MLWLMIKSALFGIVMFLAMQGLYDIIGLSKSIPSQGAIVFGFISLPNWMIIEKCIIMDNFNKTFFKEKK